MDRVQLTRPVAYCQEQSYEMATQRFCSDAGGRRERNEKTDGPIGPGYGSYLSMTRGFGIAYPNVSNDVMYAKCGNFSVSIFGKEKGTVERTL